MKETIEGRAQRLKAAGLEASPCICGKGFYCGEGCAYPDSVVHVSHPERIAEERDRYKKALEETKAHLKRTFPITYDMLHVYQIAKSALNPDSVNNQK